MKIYNKAALVIIGMAASTTAFAPTLPALRLSSTAVFAEEEAKAKSSIPDLPRKDIDYREVMMKAIDYQPGAADTAFAKKYRGLVGAEVKTVGEAFAEFTDALGFSVNALYKSMVTDLVGTTHLIVVNARFERDPVWSLGILTSLDLLLKNYPEQEIAAKIVTSLFTSMDMDEAQIKADAKELTDWVQGKTKEEVEAALAGEGDSILATTANKIKGEEFWMYSRYFGLGLLKMMDIVGIEQDKDEVYPVIELWMKDKLGKSYITACSDSDMYFRIKGKLEMMETMMKEIEIREKKRMAERFEEKAEIALRQAEREEEFNKVAADEAEEKKKAEAEKKEKIEADEKTNSFQ